MKDIKRQIESIEKFATLGPNLRRTLGQFVDHYERKVYESPYSSVVEVHAPALGIDKHTYTHCDTTDSKSVVVLPYRDHQGKREFLLRHEIVSAHGLQPVWCSITGGVEPGVNHLDQAVAELKEESGYQVGVEDMRYLGESMPWKGCDVVMHMYCVDLTGSTRGKAIGDGSKVEDDAMCDWRSLADMIGCKDPLLHACFLRAHAHPNVSI